MTEDQIKHMVDRFLWWRLPEDFRPDCGIKFDADAAKKLNPRNARYEPVGTNLLTYTQAEAMVRHMVDGLASPAVPVEVLEALNAIADQRTSSADLTPWGRGYHAAIERCSELAQKGLAALSAHRSVSLTQVQAAFKALYQVADELDGEIDEQTYDERVKADFDQPDDAELCVIITAKQYREYGKAINTASAALSDLTAILDGRGK